MSIPEMNVDTYKINGPEEICRLKPERAVLIFEMLELVHEGEVAPHYISLIALLAHPILFGVTVSELPHVNMSFAQTTVLMIPPGRDELNLGVSR
jgi:hypothetical protein